MKILDEKKIAELFAAAAENPRKRINFNFHESTEDPTNRLCIAVLPGSFFPVQRHPDRWELLTLLQGEIISYAYDDDGRVIAENHMAPGKITCVELPPGTWHNLAVLKPSLFLEVKPGPYAPVAPEDTAPFDGRHE